jgi:hypothetical protein
MNLKYTPPGLSAITLSNVRLSSFNVENIYDGENFNRSGRKETVSGTAIISGNPLASATGAIDVIRNSLNSPRGKLELQFTSDTGTWYVLADGSDGASAGDARQGPMPNVSVSRIEGNHSNAVTFVTFTFTYFTCGGTRLQKFEMNVTQNLDEAGFITMTRSGSLRISARPSAQNQIAPLGTPQIIPNVSNQDYGNSPDLYRNLIAGKPGPFFRRVRQNFVLDASLTTLTFDIEDRMVFRELKYPVMMGDASFTYERGLQNMLGTKTFNAHFEGEPDTPPGLLLNVAVEAAMARIDFLNDLVQSISVREPNIYTRNRVELTVQAQGQSDKQVDISVVRDMFTDPHSGGTTRYVSAYPTGGQYVNKITGLRWDPCLTPDIISNVIENNPDAGGTESTLDVANEDPDADIEDSEGNNETTPLQPDNGLNDPENKIKHLDGTQDFHTEDSGVRYLEATGGYFQWPFQTRMPQVVVTQVVRYVSNTMSPAIPYPQIGEPFVVLNERISVNNAPPDATGKPVFAVVATRQIQVQTASSPNTRTAGEAFPRRVWAPAAVSQARGLYSSNNEINSLQIDASGAATRSDYASDQA